MKRRVLRRQASWRWYCRGCGRRSHGNPGRRAISLPGSASCQGSTRPAERLPSSVPASGVIPDWLGAWLDQWRTRMHPNKVVVTLAAKMARLAWVILNRPGHCTNGARGSHHGLAATEAHLREAGYIDATAVVITNSSLAWGEADHTLPEATSFRMIFSSVSSASAFRSLPFSCSSCFSASTDPASGRHIRSATASSSAPSRRSSAPPQTPSYPTPATPRPSAAWHQSPPACGASSPSQHPPQLAGLILPAGRSYGVRLRSPSSSRPRACGSVTARSGPQPALAGRRSLDGRRVMLGR